MLGVLHYWWLVKADVRRPLTYGVVVAVLLGARVVLRAQARPRACAGATLRRARRVGSARLQRRSAIGFSAVARRLQPSEYR